MPRILVCNANTTTAVTDACAAAARAAASPGTEIVAVTPRFGPKVIATRVENAIAAHGILDALAEHAPACDGAILAVSYDTALEAARQLLPVPVLGMTEAACLVACTVATRFGLATFNQPDVYGHVVAGHGLGSRLCSVHITGGQATDMFADPAGTSARLLAAIERCVGDGAEAVILGGAALAGQAARLQPKAPVPLLDGITCATVLIEALIRLGLPRATVGSLIAPRRESTALSGHLTRLLAGRA
jgi:allantoin racemase